jgi:hypothetical protein
MRLLAQTVKYNNAIELLAHIPQAGLNMSCPGGSYLASIRLLATNIPLITLGQRQIPT